MDREASKIQRCIVCDERFAIPGVGGIIIKCADGKPHILIQERHKKDARSESGLIEIPAGKIRQFENIYDCLRREVWEETGLCLSSIEGEDEAELMEVNGYRVLSYHPFASSQNLEGSYPIMVQVFICHVRDDAELIDESNESKNLRWVDFSELGNMLEDRKSFYPMHIATLVRFLKREEAGSLTVVST
jgi:8-oxo-dGTP pyrophosphatase MutT (NUDIX family)